MTENAENASLQVVQAMGLSSKLSATAIALRRAGILGRSSARDYEIVRLLYDKTARGDQEIMREFARRAARRRSLPAKALQRSEIVHYLTQQALAGSKQSEAE